MSRRLLAGAVVCWSLLGTGTARAADDDPWFGYDKALHFGVSVGLGAGGYGGSALFFDEYWLRALSGAAFSLSIGAAKEIYDATGAGDPSWKDLTWDLVGTSVGVGLAFLVDLAIRGEPHPQAQSQALQGLSLSW